jgi:hypothetical protein
VVIDAVGPEIFSFEELVRSLARAVRSRAVILHASPGPCSRCRAHPWSIFPRRAAHLGRAQRANG